MLARVYVGVCVFERVLTLSSFDVNKGTPIMTIASHELKGKVQTLQQPLVIMKPRSKRTNVESSSASNESNKRMKVGTDKMDVDKMDEQHDGYEVAGVVTSKILFDRYPKSIMK